MITFFFKSLLFPSISVLIELRERKRVFKKIKIKRENLMWLFRNVWNNLSRRWRRRAGERTPPRKQKAHIHDSHPAAIRARVAESGDISSPLVSWMKGALRVRSIITVADSSFFVYAQYHRLSFPFYRINLPSSPPHTCRNSAGYGSHKRLDCLQRWLPCEPVTHEAHISLRYFFPSLRVEMFAVRSIRSR